MAAAAVSCLAVLIGGCGSGSAPGGDAPGPPGGGAEEPVVHFANFPEEIGRDTLEQFTRETGIDVVYDVYESNAMLDAKLLSGRTGYDVVVPGNNFLENQLKAGIYRPLDRSKLSNWNQLDVEILRLLERNDPGNRYAVPYLFGTHSIGFNVSQVRAALGAEPPASSRLLFDPKYARRLQRCGIILPDSAWIVIPHALLYLGRDPNSQSVADLEAAMKVLREIRPYVRDISNALQVADYAEGQACLFLGPSADVRLARDQANQARTGVELRYQIPEEGALLWFDLLAIPADAPHPENAHKLINFLMRPDVIAKVTEATYFANANRGADAHVPAALLHDPLIYPDQAALDRLHVVAAANPDYARLLNREFSRFKTAR
jgi:putrescine transport system substrate-binding protein